MTNRESILAGRALRESGADLRQWLVLYHHHGSERVRARVIDVLPGRGEDEVWELVRRQHQDGVERLAVTEVGQYLNAAVRALEGGPPWVS